MKLSELGEFGLIERIRARAGVGADVVRGIGDDAAELIVPAGHRLLTSTDLLIEGVHFRHAWTDPFSLGYKAAAVNLSDIAAMGGAPRFLYLGLACPDDVDTAMLEPFLEGVLAAIAPHQAVLAGGDTCRSPGPWVISVTVEGVIPENQSVGRNGARPGDAILVSGTLGDSALALAQLQGGGVPDPALAQRHHRPEPRVAMGRALAGSGLATALIDISDGLSADLEHILQASGVDGVIDPAKLPLSEAFQACLATDPNLLKCALSGGEDYELLATVPAERVIEAQQLGRELGLPLTVIGSIRAGQGRLHALAADGSERTILVSGYDHFCP